MDHAATYHTRFGLELFEGVLSAHVYPWHFHPAYTIVLVEKGSMKYVYRNRAVVLQENQVHLVNPFTSHYNFPIRTCHYKALFLPLDPLLKNEQTRYTAFKNDVADGKPYADLLRIFEKAKALSDQQACERLKNRVGELLRTHFPFENKVFPADVRILPAITFIQNHLGEKLSTDVISQTCHLSRFHFQRVFKECVGLTVNEYIQQQRTEFTKALLREGRPATSTGLDAGYFDQSHFHKAFKKMWVARPSGLR